MKALGFREETDTYQSSLRDLAGVIALAYDAGEAGIARQLQGRLEGSVKDPTASTPRNRPACSRPPMPSYKKALF